MSGDAMRANRPGGRETSEATRGRETRDGAARAALRGGLLSLLLAGAAVAGSGAAGAGAGIGVESGEAPLASASSFSFFSFSFFSFFAWSVSF